MTEPLFADRLKDAMRAAGCRPADLAVLLDLPLPTLQRWLSDLDFLPRRRQAIERRQSIEKKLARIHKAVAQQRLPVDQSLPINEIKEALRSVRNEFLYDPVR